jgi:HEAT repeat protein
LKSEAPSAGMLDDLSGLPPGTDLADWEDPKVLPLVEVRDLFLVLGKALRAYQLYDRKNPVYRRFLDALVEAFRLVWTTEETLHLVVEENRITWKGEEVYRNDQRSDSLAFLLYRDGVREFTPMAGIEDTELEGLLDVLHRAKHARGDADDLVTLLWDQEFHLLRYEVVDLMAEGVEVPDAGAGVLDNPLDILRSEGFSLLDGEEPAGEAAEDGSAGDAEDAGAAAPDGTVRLEDFNPTLHALEPEDRAYIAELIQGEIDRDLRIDVLTALFDRFEEAGRPDRQREISGILGQLLPNLLSRGWMREVGFMLAELEEVRRSGSIDPVAEAQVDEALATLASPESVAELVRAMEDGSLTSTSQELATFLRHLRSSALAPLLSAVETTQHPQIRRRLKDAIREIARTSPEGVFQLLRSSDVLVVSGAVRLVGTLGLPQAMQALATLLATAPLPVRRAVVESAIELPSPALAEALGKSLFHEDRNLRIGAARALGVSGHAKSASLLEEILGSPEFRETDVGEKVAFFDAYGRLAGSRGVPVLDRMLNGRGLFGYREPAENRAGAARALGVVGTEAALQALRKAERDSDPIVRSSVSRALQGQDEGVET